MTISPDDDGRASPIPPGSEPARAPDVSGLALRSPPSYSQVRASIMAPGDWTELDLDPATRHTSIRRAVRRAMTRSRNLAPDAVTLIALLDQIVRRADETRAFYCASLIIEDASVGAWVATVMMQVCESATVPPPQTLSLPASERCAALAAAIRDDLSWSGANVRVVRLPLVGPAVRLQMRNDGIILQYIVPLIGGIADLLLTFSCPCPPYADLMTELFDTMAESLVLHVR
jgi:hypothetical protein